MTSHLAPSYQVPQILIRSSILLHTTFKPSIYPFFIAVTPKKNPHKVTITFKMNSQAQGSYANEMDPIQTGSQPTGQPYTTTETTTTTHTSRTPHHSTTSTTAGTMGTSGGVVGGEKKGLGHTIKDMGTTLVGTADALRGSFNETVDKLAGDVSFVAFSKTQDWSDHDIC